MKTKDLIAALQEADPTGEVECCVGNADIHCVYQEAAYWDGCLQVLIHDPAKKPYYDIIGGKYVASGNKVVIRPLSISDAIFNDENLPVYYEGMSEQKQQDYQKMVQDRRNQTKSICNDVEREFFVQYITEKYCQHDDFELDDIKIAAGKFYDENMDYKDSMPEDILKGKKKENISGQDYEVVPSWNTRRRLQWDREIGIDIKDGKVCFVFKS